MGRDRRGRADRPADPVPAGYGSGIPAERPFRSLSFPDIDYTVMRPATLPPSPFTNPPSTDPLPPTRDPGVRNPKANISG